MCRRTRTAPFQICIPSAVHPPDHMDGNGRMAKRKKMPAGLFARWMIAAAMAVLLLWGILRSSVPDPGRGAAPPAAAKQQAQPKEDNIGWEDADLGMVLLDIANGQAALALRVPEPGVYVLAVDKESPAHRAGVQPGDHIAAINGEPVGSVEELRAAFAMLGYGDAAELGIRRGRDKVTLTIEADGGRERLRLVNAPAFLYTGCEVVHA